MFSEGTALRGLGSSSAFLAHSSSGLGEPPTESKLGPCHFYQTPCDSQGAPPEAVQCVPAGRLTRLQRDVPWWTSHLQEATRQTVFSPANEWRHEHFPPGRAQPCTVFQTESRLKRACVRQAASYTHCTQEEAPGMIVQQPSRKTTAPRT